MGTDEAAGAFVAAGLLLHAEVVLVQVQEIRLATVHRWAVEQPTIRGGGGTNRLLWDSLPPPPDSKPQKTTKMSDDARSKIPLKGSKERGFFAGVFPVDARKEWPPPHPWEVFT